jgi:hypothetical protein
VSYISSLIGQALHLSLAPLEGHGIDGDKDDLYVFDELLLPKAFGAILFHPVHAE